MFEISFSIFEIMHAACSYTYACIGRSRLDNLTFSPCQAINVDYLINIYYRKLDTVIWFCYF